MRKRDKKKNQKDTLKALTMILQLGMTMIICMGMSLGIGFYIDKLFGTKYWTIIMMVIGILAALRSMLVMTGVYHPGTQSGTDDADSGVEIRTDDAASGVERGNEDESGQN